ncbi:TM2 domain-containing protein [Deinococcus sp. JMULE3]|uniref:TM2 domain-containing protein n=1 Tax=Deinococcus sp. JMULE3 TaxID=2518341 RepID=UPI0020C7354C|nr:NINE protein [Deinococcus sp. JMULE3]
MTNPDDKQPDASSNAPSWVDEVLGGSSTSPATPTPKPAGADDLRIPDATPRAAAPSWVDEVAGSGQATPPARPADPTPAPSWVDAAAGTASTPPGPAAPSWVDQVAGSSAAHTPQPQPQPAHHVPPAPAAPTVVPPPRPTADDDWVARATGGAKNPSIPQGPAPMHHAPSQSGNFDDLERQARQAINQFTQGVQSGDVAQKKLIAGLLAIFLGSLGVHKFYLGNTQPGVIMLAATIGGWILGIIGSFIIVGAVFFLVPMLVSLLGLVEGIIYFTKSDADFQREYISGKKAWL